jgi:hypothetical protein
MRQACRLGSNRTTPGPSSSVLTSPGPSSSVLTSPGPPIIHSGMPGYHYESDDNTGWVWDRARAASLGRAYNFPHQVSGTAAEG